MENEQKNITILKTTARLAKIREVKRLLGEKTTAKTFDRSLEIVLNISKISNEIPPYMLKKLVGSESIGRFIE